MQIIQVYQDIIDITSDFAKDVFIDYYNDLIGNKQATYMADLFLSKQAIEKLISQGAVFKIVLEENVITGFMEYIKEDDRLFLSKLYVHKDYRKHKIGRMMFEECKDYARKNNLSNIYLTVNKYNTYSIEVYKHLGFTIIDSVVNDIGNGYVMDDYIMQYTL